MAVKRYFVLEDDHGVLGELKSGGLVPQGAGFEVFGAGGEKPAPIKVAAADPSVVVYQLTTYDWGTEQEQRAGYDRLLTTVTDAGAELVFVTSPPIRPDDFYRPHMADLDRAPEVARAVAAGTAGVPSSATAPSTSVRSESGFAPRARRKAAVATISRTAAASTGTSSSRIRLLPPTKRPTRRTATPANTATLSACVTGISTASTKPGGRGAAAA